MFDKILAALFSICLAIVLAIGFYTIFMSDIFPSMRWLANQCNERGYVQNSNMRINCQVEKE